MKIDHEYIRKILFAVESINSPRPYLKEILYELDLEKAEDDFIVNYEVLIDYGFIETLSKSGSNGIQQTPDGNMYWVDIPLRITSDGHEFIEALNRTEVWEIIKNDFKEESIKTIFSVATELALNFTKNKLEKYINEK